LRQNTRGGSKQKYEYGRSQPNSRSVWSARVFRRFVGTTETAAQKKAAEYTRTPDASRSSVRSREMLDVLLEAGADINAKSRWWAGGFGLLHSAEPALASYAIQRGAVVDIHAAARLGMMDRVRELIGSDPALVHARGGDGQTALHFANSIEIAEFLLEHGAEIDARDIDHESTPAQWMIRERQQVAAYLVKRGCKTDLLMAAALGQEELVRRHLELDPDCIRMRVSHEYFRMINPKSGGTIYQWTLGWYVSAHDVAKQFGHERIRALLLDHTPADVKLATAAWGGDEPAVAKLLAQNPGLPTTLSAADRRLLAHAARNNDLAAVRAMLRAGWPLDATSQHGATALHWAAFHGNAEMIREILRHNPPLEGKDPEFNATPLGWAIYGSEHGWHCEEGDYVGAVEALLGAGAKIPDESGTGTQAVKELLRSRR
jgi:ankyrin repeat protein